MDLTDLMDLTNNGCNLQEFNNQHFQRFKKFNNIQPLPSPPLPPNLEVQGSTTVHSGQGLYFWCRGSPVVVGSSSSLCRSCCDAYSPPRGCFSLQNKWIHLNVTHNAFNVHNRRKSNGLENLTDQWLTEVTFWSKD